MSEYFVCELPLRVSCSNARQLDVRFEAARHIYNACLGEALRVLQLLRESKAWQLARELPRSKTRGSAFREVIGKFDFKKSMLERYAIRCKNACWIKDHLGSHETQALAARAFSAVEQYAFGKRGRPRFKGARSLHCISGKSNAAGIRYRDGAIAWNGLVLPCLRNPRDNWQQEALLRKIQFCKVVRRNLRGTTRYYVQLTVTGKPPVKLGQAIGEGKVGFDIGPSTIAVVSDKHARLQKFCPQVEQPWARMRVLQRAMDRSRRAMNPDNYSPDGQITRGVKLFWVKSAGYRVLQGLLSETERVLAATRKTEHGRLSNEILALGKYGQTEKLSYRAWQRGHYGRSLKVRAPGMFIEMYRRKAARAGGGLLKFPTRSTRYSQLCHGCGGFVKKPLSLRVHACACGVGPVQRDLYSAFLARHYEVGKLDVSHAKLAWPGAEPLLVQAASSVLLQPTRGSALVEPTEFPSERVACKREQQNRTRPRTTYPMVRTGGEGCGESGLAASVFGTPRLYFSSTVILP